MHIKIKRSSVIVFLLLIVISVSCSAYAYLYYSNLDTINYNELENTIIKDDKPNKGSFEEYTTKYGLWKINKVLVYKDGRKYFIIDQLLPEDKVGKNDIIDVRNPTEEEVIEYSKERWKLNETKTVH